MFYVIGFTFTAGRNTPSSTGGSIQQQRQQSLLNKSVAISSPFTPGKQYRLFHIRPIKIEETKRFKFEYIFQESNTQNFVPVEFNSTTDADNYIARIAGKIGELQQVREQVRNALQSDSL